jgi:Transposase DDE domain
MDAKEGPMSFYSTKRALPQRFRLILSSFMQQDNLPFADVLPEATIEQAFADADADFAQFEDDVYTPALTLWAFLSQVLHTKEMRSCAAAVARVIVLLVALGKDPCSDNTGAYCRARAKLPAAIIRRLTTDVAKGCAQRLPARWLWKGLRVKLIDGTTVSMPDTPDNQAAYPQAKTQKEGVGFPIARMVVLLSLATAMVTDMAMGQYSGKETGEPALMRELLERLEPGDVVLADRCYCSYFMIALLQELHIDFVVRLHHCRDVNFRRGRRLGAGDHVVAWTKPARPDWMDEATYERMPESIEVREVHVQVNQPGFRTESLVVVTTLTDAEEYTKDDIGELYHQRWLVELDIRAIKVTLGMDVLRCQSAEMVRREIWTCLLAYNLIRQTMLEAALKSERSPRQLSFTAALQKIAAAWAVLSVCDDALRAQLIEVQLSDIANNVVGDRPNRVEPRAIKRRPKPHKFMNEPRADARAKLINGTAA